MAWFYPDPLPEVARIGGLLSFWRGAEVYVCGERVATGMPGEP